MKTRRILSMLICICMLASTVFSSVPAFAMTENVTENIGDISSYSVAETNTSTNELPVPIDQKTEVPEDYIGIYTAEDLDNVRNDLNANYILMADIDLSEYENWIPIGIDIEGQSETSYGCTFDGNGFSVNNMNICVNEQYPSFANVGLFATLLGGTIKNLKLINISITHEDTIYNNYFGGIVGYSCYGIIDNCFVSGEINVNTSGVEYVVGGAVAESEGTVSNISSSVIINYDNETNCGGIFAGGIIGKAKSKVFETEAHLSIENCRSSSIISGKGQYGYIGGIVGQVVVSSECIYSISNNTYFGDISTSGEEYVGYIGGIVGGVAVLDNSGIIINGCQNVGDIVSGLHAGGIVCLITTEGSLNEFLIEQCANIGNIEIESNGLAGGLIGGVYLDVAGTSVHGDIEPKIVNCYNSGNVISSYEYSSVGGLLDVLNTGSVSSFEISNSYVASEKVSGTYGNSSIVDLVLNDSTTEVNINIESVYCIDSLDCDFISSTDVSGNITVSAEKLSDAEMQSADSFVGFDFDSVWEIGKAEDYNYPTLIDNPHRGIAVEPEIPEEPSEITSTWDTTSVNLNEGEEYSFVGSVSTTAENGLKDLQININSATDDTVGIKHFRASDIGLANFDLSAVQSLTVNATLSDDEQTIVLAPGTTWEVQLWATDTDGNSIGDAEIMILTIAEEQISDSIYWDGSIAKSFAGGTGTENDPYRIETAAQLVYFIMQIASGVTYENEYIILLNDIVLNKVKFSYDADTSMIICEEPNGNVLYYQTGNTGWNIENGNTQFDENKYEGWYSFNTDTNEYVLIEGYSHTLNIIDNSYYVEGSCFKGSFNGNQKCIYGIASFQSGLYCKSLFYNSYGEIKNLNIANSAISSVDEGVIANSNYGTIDNCHVDAIIVVSSGRTGGLVGSNSGIIKNSTYNGIIRGGTYTGGIAGRSQQDIINCTNYGDIYASDNVGGITGYLYTHSSANASDSALIENCKNYGEIYGADNVGGICGIGYNEAYNSNSILKIENSHNYGMIDGTKNIAGILGYLDSDDKLALSYITNCSNKGNVSATENYVGGIIGYQDVSNNLRDDVLGVKVAQCFNTGDIIGNTYVGGLIGYSEPWYWCTVILEDCYNSGNVSGNSYVAGIVSNVYSFWMAGIRFSNLYNIGTVTSLDSNIGSIVCKFQNYGYTILENLYFNSALNGIVETDIEDDSKVVNIIGYTDSELQNGSSYIGFDFDTIWEIGVTEGYPYPTLRDNPHVKGTDEPSVPDEPEIPEEPSEITSTWGTTSVTLNEGEEYSFVGSVSTTAENGLKDLQININSATDDTVGIMHFRAPDIGLANFDLSAVPSLTVNAELSDDEQTIVLAPGTTWEVQLWATDTDGNAIGDAEIMILTIAEVEEPSEITIDWDKSDLTLNADERFAFAGEISTTAEGGLDTVSVMVKSASDDFEFRFAEWSFSGTPKVSFDLSEINAKGQRFGVGYEYYSLEDDIHVIIEEGTSWYIQICAIDKDGNNLGEEVKLITFAEKEIETGRPTVDGLSESYEITLGESFVLNGTVSAVENGLLNKVTLKHNQIATIFESQTLNIALESSTADLSEFIISADEYPLNTVGTHEFIIYASADNFTETNNIVARFNVVVKSNEHVCTWSSGKDVTGTGICAYVDSKTHIRESVEKEYECLVCGATKIERVLGKDENPPAVPEPHRTNYQKIKATYYEKLETSHDDYTTKHKVVNVIELECTAKGCGYTIPGGEKYTYENHNLKDGVCTACGFGSSIEDFVMDKDCHYILVSNEDGEVITGAKVMIGGSWYKTDENGFVAYPIVSDSQTSGHSLIQINADGYNTKQILSSLERGEVDIVILEKSSGSAPYFMAIQDLNYHDLTIEQVWFTENSDVKISIFCTVSWNGWDEGEIVIYQEGNILARRSSYEGFIYLYPGKDLDPSKPVYARIEYGLNRNTEPVELKIGVIKAGNYGSGTTIGDLEDLTGFKIAEEREGSIGNPEVLRFFPGDFELNVGLFPIKISKEIKADGTSNFKAAIGLVDYDFSEKSWGTLVDTIIEESDAWNKENDRSRNSRNKTWAGIRKDYNFKVVDFTLERKILNPTVEALGYIELEKDKNGNTIAKSSKVLVDGKLTLAKLTKQFWTPIGPWYFDVDSEVGVNLDFGISSYSETKGWLFDSAFSAKGKLSIGGGYGVAKIFTIGAKGSAELEADIFPENKGEFTASANLTAYIWGAGEWNYPLAKITLPLWGGEQTRAMMSLRALNNGGSISLVSRDYTSKTSEWNGYPVSLMSLEESPETFTTLQEYIMPNTLPELVRVGDKYILLFQTDDSERQAGNNIVLMYSVYDENIGGWAEPLSVSEGVSSDFYPEIFVHNDELYVAWLKLPNEVSSEDAESLMNEISGGVDISFAKWNKEEGKFEQSYVNSDDKLDMMPYLAFCEDKITAVWLSNSNSNIMEYSGVESIMTSSLVNGEWTEPVELYTSDKYISEIVAGYVDGELVVFYSINEEDVLENVYMLSNGISTLISGQTAYGTSLNFYDGCFYWVTEGVLNEYDVSSDTLSTITSGDSKVINSSYRFVENSSDTAIVWLSTTDDESVIYASIKTEDGFSNPFVILSTSDYSIKYMDVEFEDDGTWKLVLNTLETSDSDIDKTSMVCVDVNVRENTTLDNVLFDERERVDGVQPMTLYLTNEGQNTINNVKVEIEDLNGNSYYSNVETCSINAGETKEIDITVDFSSISELTDIKIYAYPENESDRTDNNISEEIGFVDVFFNVEHYYVENNLILATTISNISDISADVVISIIEDSEDGKIVTAKEITGITNAKDYVFLYSLDREYIDFGEEGYKRYYITIEPLSKDYVESDNSDIISVYPVKEEHEHSISSEYSSDKDNHWQSCDDCNEHIGVESHIESDWIIDVEATSSNKGSKHIECVICGYIIKSEDIPETDIPPYLLWAYIQSLKNKTYTIEAVAGNGGTISNVGKTEVKHGETYTYYITPNEGYSIKTVYIDGVDIGAVTEYTFSNITSPQKISVEFIKNKPDIETPSIEIKTTVFSIKNVVAGEIANSISEFKYKLILDDENINGVYGDVIFSNGIAKFTMKNNSEVVVTDLPVGLKYVVIQEDQENYITSTIATEGILTSEHVNAYFINIANKPSTDIIDNPVTSDDEN